MVIVIDIQVPTFKNINYFFKDNFPENQELYL